YSPVQQTVEGEPLEIYPFVGSSRLEEPLSRFPVSFVVHGHAHRGQPEGVTRTNVPVYNVSMPLLTRVYGDRPPFRVLEMQVGERTAGEPVPAGSTPTAAAMQPRTPGRRATDLVAS